MTTFTFVTLVTDFPLVSKTNAVVVRVELPPDNVSFQHQLVERAFVSRAGRLVGSPLSGSPGLLREIVTWRMRIVREGEVL